MLISSSSPAGKLMEDVRTRLIGDDHTIKNVHSSSIITPRKKSALTSVQRLIRATLRANRAAIAPHPQHWQHWQHWQDTCP